MIQPVEMRATRALTLPGGGAATTDEVWGMLSACRDGDLARVQDLIARNPALVQCQYNYTRPIHFAVREGHLDLTRYLVERGADLAYRSEFFHDSLLTMARDREHEAIAALLERLAAQQFPVAHRIAEFLGAARRGDLAVVEAALARTPDLARASDETGDTALHQAATGGHLQIVERLLAAGAAVDARRGDGARPIHCALMTRQAPLRAGTIAGVLLTRGAQYNIYLAAVLGDAEFVRAALARDASQANFEDTNHRRPLSAAARRSDLDMVASLLRHGADPNLPEAGATRGAALWIAVHQRQREMVTLLLEHGADPNASVESGGSVYLHGRKDPAIARLLLEHGADPQDGDLNTFEMLVSDDNPADVEEVLRAHPELARNETAFWGEGVLSVPANHGHREMIELLMRYGARVPDVSKWGREYYFKRVDIGEFLLARHANPNHMNWQHTLVLHELAHAGDLARARLMLDHGAAIDAVDEEYQSTPLGVAVRAGQTEMAAVLLERGADPNLSGAPWATPRAWARKKGHTDLDARLHAAGAR